MFFCCKSKKSKAEAMRRLEEVTLEDVTPRASYEELRSDAIQDDLPIFGDYAQLCAITGSRESRVYYVFHYVGSHEVYWHLSKQGRSTGDRKDGTGWKIHISVMNAEENVVKAWRLVAAKVIEYGVYETKVVGSRYLGRDQHQMGKEIVIYEFSSRADIDWQNFLQELENDFRRNGVIAGECPKFRLPEEMDDEINEPSIRGSEYFYCETDDMRERLRKKTCLCCRRKVDYEDRGVFKDITISTLGGASP